MSNLSIRKLDKTQAVSAPERISDVFQKHFGPSHGIDLILQNPWKPHEPMDFNE